MAPGRRRRNTTPPPAKDPAGLPPLRPFSKAQLELFRAALPSEAWLKQLRAALPSEEWFERFRAEYTERKAEADKAEPAIARWRAAIDQAEREKSAAMRALAQAPRVIPQQQAEATDPVPLVSSDDWLIATAIRLKANNEISVRAFKHKAAFAKQLAPLMKADPTVRPITWRSISTHKLEELKLWPIDLIPAPPTNLSK